MPSTKSTNLVGATEATLERGFRPSNDTLSPKIGAKPIDAIGRADVLTVLTRIWSTRPETARRVRQRMRTIFRWGHGE